MSIVLECRRHGVVINHENRPICPKCEASPSPGSCSHCGQPMRGLFRKQCRNPHCIAGPDLAGYGKAPRANAIRLDPPAVVFVTDEPGGPIRLAWTDSEGRFFTRELAPQHTINLIEDLSRALRSRIGGAR